MTHAPRVELVPLPVEGEMGLDVIITDRTASVGDLLRVMQHPADDPRVYKPLHRSRYGVCAGCLYNCCKSNDIPIDLLSAQMIAHRQGITLRKFMRIYLRSDESVMFPELRIRPCPFLIDNRCGVYEERALVCRLYLCTPMSDRLEKLRACVLLMGNGALREIMVRESLATRRWRESELQKMVARASDPEWESDMLNRILHRNPYLLDAGHDEVKLLDCCPDSLWRLFF